MSPATSAYLHIPFCRRRCFYCDFAISVVGDRLRGGTSLAMADYVEVLIQEIQATPSEYSQSQPLQTVFFGGGTPSLLESFQIDRLLRALDSQFGIAPNAEVSMELDPATFDLAQLEGYWAAGVNRISLGAQAFDDEQLAAAGRFHRREDVLEAIALIHQSPFTNFSIDLISGLPHQTLESWQNALEQALSLSPKHLSIYDLIVEPQTAFSRRFTPGEAPLPSDHTTAEMYRVAQASLSEVGFDHYEICNFTQPGYAARHNLTYWRCQPHYGFGMGATSYLGHQRIDRPRTQKTYRQWLADYVEQGGKTNDPVLTSAERVMETFMMGLRLKEGIGLTAVEQVFEQAGLDAVWGAITPHVESGWVIVEPGLQTRIRLSDPEGFLMSNQVIIDAFNALEILEPLTA